MTQTASAVTSSVATDFPQFPHFDVGTQAVLRGSSLSYHMPNVGTMWELNKAESTKKQEENTLFALLPHSLIPTPRARVNRPISGRVRLRACGGGNWLGERRHRIDSVATTGMVRSCSQAAIKADTAERRRSSNPP